MSVACCKSDSGCPHAELAAFSLATDIFSLGTILYEIFAKSIAAHDIAFHGTPDEFQVYATRVRCQDLQQNLTYVSSSIARLNNSVLKSGYSLMTAHVPIQVARGYRRCVRTCLHTPCNVMQNFLYQQDFLGLCAVLPLPT